jgi:hypothetical protein
LKKAVCTPIKNELDDSAAAFLMMTGALLVRQYLKGETTCRLQLYMVGMILAFNLGRDTTLITLYPFLFGFIMLVVFSRARGGLCNWWRGVVEEIKVCVRSDWSVCSNSFLAR